MGVTDFVLSASLSFGVVLYCSRRFNVVRISAVHDAVMNPDASSDQQAAACRAKVTDFAPDFVTLVTLRGAKS